MGTGQGRDTAWAENNQDDQGLCWKAGAGGTWNSRLSHCILEAVLVAGDLCELKILCMSQATQQGIWSRPSAEDGQVLVTMLDCGSFMLLSLVVGVGGCTGEGAGLGWAATQARVQIPASCCHGSLSPVISNTQALGAVEQWWRTGAQGLSSLHTL